MPTGRSLEQVYDRLFAWCEARNFAGHDPFDALNSRILQRTPLRHGRVARLALTQAVKRSPIDLRPVLRVPAGVNAKGIALFALAELARYRTSADKRHAANARVLLDQLLSMGYRDGSTLAFGYNFDWQSRQFFAPAGTPTVVPTAFASQAFAEGFAAFADESYRNAVDEIAEFAATRLQRPVETERELCFSYTPLDSSVIYNASLLAAECLVCSSNAEHHELAAKAVNFAIGRQRDDGAWVYGDAPNQQWVDNFHTAYVLVSLKRISDAFSESISANVTSAIANGTAYWIENFFLENGTPKYYSIHRLDPIDIHSAAVAIAAAAELGEMELAKRVAAWTIRNMGDTEGFFYYRVGRVLVDQTPYMRWGQAWMAYAIARLLEAR